MLRKTSVFSRPSALGAALLLALSACGAPEGASAGDDPPAPGAAEDLVEDPTVYDEPPAGDKADGVELAFHVVEGFQLPAAVATGETRRIFRSAASFRGFTGVEPAGVDFSREHAILYSAGTLPKTGSRARITALRVAGATLHVSTQLVAPGPGCASETRPDRPYVLVRFTPPSPSPRYLRYYRGVATGEVCRTDPWPACEGALTDSGIDDIVLTHRKGGIWYRSPYQSYNSSAYQLGRYGITRWRRTCRGEACDAWAPLPAPAYAAGAAYLYYSGASRRLLAMGDVVTYPFDIGGGMTKTCWRWSESMGDLSAGGELPAALNLQQNSGCDIGGTTGAGGPEIRDSYGNLYGFTGKVADRCLQLQKATTRQIGPTVYEETRTVLSSAW